jgi:hypothetical protein
VCLHVHAYRHEHNVDRHVVGGNHPRGGAVRLAPKHTSAQGRTRGRSRLPTHRIVLGDEAHRRTDRAWHVLAQHPRRRLHARCGGAQAQREVPARFAHCTLVLKMAAIPATAAAGATPEAAALAELLAGADPAVWVAHLLSGSDGSEATEQTASAWILRLQRHSNDLGVRLDEVRVLLRAGLGLRPDADAPMRRARARRRPRPWATCRAC